MAKPKRLSAEERIKAQNRKSIVISAMCREIDKVMPRNGETVAEFKRRTSRKRVAKDH